MGNKRERRLDTSGQVQTTEDLGHQPQELEFYTVGPWSLNFLIMYNKILFEYSRVFKININIFINYMQVLYCSTSFQNKKKTFL